MRAKNRRGYSSGMEASLCCNLSPLLRRLVELLQLHQSEAGLVGAGNEVGPDGRNAAGKPGHVFGTFPTGAPLGNDPACVGRGLPEEFNDRFHAVGGLFVAAFKFIKQNGDRVAPKGLADAGLSCRPLHVELGKGRGEAFDDVVQGRGLACALLPGYPDVGPPGENPADAGHREPPA
jgi:hypothetical protein